LYLFLNKTKTVNSPYLQCGDIVSTQNLRKQLHFSRFLSH